MDYTCLACSKPINGDKAHYGMHEECFIRIFSLNKLEFFSDVAIRYQSEAPAQGEKRNINSSFFHGKFRKYSSRLGGVSYILKTRQKEFPELPLTEFVCNQLYEALKINIPPYYLVRFPESEFCFITKNFMPNSPPSTLVHIYHYIENDMIFDCETLVNVIGEQTGRRIDQESFVYLTLADSLIGNNDRHGRNLGFIQSANKSTIAPFYDNPSALGIEDVAMLGADLQPRGCIYRKDSKERLIKDYVLEWERLGYQNVIENFQKNLSLPQLCDIIHLSYLSDKRKQALIALIDKRSSEICIT